MWVKPFGILVEGYRGRGARCAYRRETQEFTTKDAKERKGQDRVIW